MKKLEALPPELLRTRCDPSQYKFKSTAEIKDSSFLENLGQKNALDSLEFGVEIGQQNYNIYAIGTPGIGKRIIIEKYLNIKAKGNPQPSDWCYVNNFKDTHKPIAIELPSGIGNQFKNDMLQLIHQLKYSIPLILESKEYFSSIKQLDQEYEELEKKTLEKIKNTAEEKNMTVLKTTDGFTIVPVKNGTILKDDELESLPESELSQIDKNAYEIGIQLNTQLESMPQWYKSKYDKERKIERRLCSRVIKDLINDLNIKYDRFSKVLTYLASVEKNIIENPKMFFKQTNENANPYGITPEEDYSQYHVNVLIDNENAKQAPVIVELNPNYSNLIGRIENRAVMGVVTSDFTLIKPGALHKANGGYLVLDISKVLINPYCWEGLKKILFTHKLTIEPLDNMIGIASTSPLEPESIAIDVKVILLGSRDTYDQLNADDPEFSKIFKVAVEFDDSAKFSSNIAQNFPRLIANIINEKNLLAFSPKAVAIVIEQCIRVTGSSERVSLHIQYLSDILNESCYWAKKNGNKVVQHMDVLHCIETSIKRVDQIQRIYNNDLRSGSILIDCKGKSIGQVNTVSIIELSNFKFGHPSRITATTRVGMDGIIDIEREINLGGAIHSKGVLILSGFIKGRFAREYQLSLSASLAFEQIYNGVEGDSASLAELCALLSSLSELPINQSLAVTGSINQHGYVQPVGAINEKIEGFFDTCKMNRLSGKQGILIPHSNIKNLMLRYDIIDAVAKDTFKIYPVKTIDEAICLLTSTPSGIKDTLGHYPIGSVNFKCESILKKYAKLEKPENK